MKLRWTRLNFSSYILLSLLMSLSFGIFMGVFLFLISLIGGNVRSYFFSFQLEGIAAGISTLLMAPVAMVIFGLFFSLLSYLPFKFLMKALKGIYLSGEYILQELQPTTEENKSI